jgi:hypothetical protein
MSDNKAKILSELDFDKLKVNISTFIANNSNYTDYNFEGSGLSFLTDILAYNTHYNAVYLNMALSESFIDTAQIRSSIVSLAKNFGYTPKSKKSSISVIDFEITEPDINKANGNVIFLTKENTFTSENSGRTFIFSPINTYSATSVNGTYKFSDVILREGSYVTVRYPVTNNAREKYIISNFNIDLDSIGVTLSLSESDTSITTFNLISDITTLTPESTIFYLFETTDRRYEITFGDGVLGTKPSSGNIVNVNYQTSSGQLANGCDIFSLANEIDGRFNNSDVNFTNIVTSYGGSEEEEIESIRINSLQSFRTQGRAVTAEDYKFFISRDYPLAQTISVWGGQDNNPPQYGKVFISFKPADGFFLSNSVKRNILNDIIKSRNVLSIIPEIIDPEYLFLIIDSEVNYNPRKTLLSPGEIESLVIEKIKEFNATILTRFGTEFNYSKFTTLIDSVDNSIENNITTLKLRKNFPVSLNRSLQYTIDFQNKIHPGTLTTKAPFKSENNPLLGNPTEDLYLEDNSNGIVIIYKLVGPNRDEKVIINNSAGTVDYITGIVKLINFNPSKVNLDNTLDLIVNPEEFSIGNIKSFRNNILTILDTEIKVNVNI